MPVKSGRLAVSLKKMMAFLLHLHICFFYGFTYLSLNSDWLKSLTNKENIGILIKQFILNINLTTLSLKFSLKFSSS